MCRSGKSACLSQRSKDVGAKGAARVNDKLLLPFGASSQLASQSRNGVVRHAYPNDLARESRFTHICRARTNALRELACARKRLSIVARDNLGDAISAAPQSSGERGRQSSRANDRDVEWLLPFSDCHVRVGE